MRNPLLSSAELSRLWKKHSAALLLMARGRCGGAGSESDDCVQEAFIKLATQTPVPDDPVAWLARVVRNSAVDSIRSNQRRVVREAEAVAQRPAWLEPVDPLASDAGFMDVTPAAAKPLSVAARRQLSQMVPSDSAVLAVHQGSNETTVGDEPEFPRLRTRTLSDLNMNDLLKDETPDPSCANPRQDFPCNYSSGTKR